MGQPLMASRRAPCHRCGDSLVPTQWHTPVDVDELGGAIGGHEPMQIRSRNLSGAHSNGSSSSRMGDRAQHRRDLVSLFLGQRPSVGKVFGDECRLHVRCVHPFIVEALSLVGGPGHAGRFGWSVWEPVAQEMATKP
jgi:hypothetical protein